MFQSWVTGLDFRTLLQKCDQGEKMSYYKVWVRGQGSKQKKR